MPTVRPVGEWNAPFIGLLRKREATDESTTERDFRKGSLLPFCASAVKKEPLLKQTMVLSNYSTYIIMGTKLICRIYSYKYETM